MSSPPPRVCTSPRRDRSGRRSVLLTVTLLLGLAGLSGCAFYSFTGATVPSHLNTIAIPLAEDNTSNPVTSLGRDLTSLLNDQFVGRTSLSLDNNESDADAVLTARIQQYTNEPSGVGGDERATTNSVQIQIQARYYDQVEDSTLIDQSFTGSADYDPSEAGLAGEREAAQLALERAAEDIFTSATSNW
ncbi:MAG: LPS assembly lipoprotein LptE [Salinivenus sp.]